MHTIKQVVSRQDDFLELIFEDDTLRAVDLTSYLRGDRAETFKHQPNVSQLSINPVSGGVVWENGVELAPDFLYEASLLIGWVDRTRGNQFHGLWVRPAKFCQAQVKVHTAEGGAGAFLLLDGKRYPALRMASATFGIYEGTPWYFVPFPGDDGIFEPEFEEPPIVFETLERLVRLVEEAKKKGANSIIDITEHLQHTGRDLSACVMSPRSAALRAEHFRARKSR